MKRFFYSMLALGGIAAMTSCASEEPIGPSNNDGKVTFTIALDAAQTRAFGETTSCNELIYTVFDMDGNVVIEDQKQNAFGPGVTTATVEMQLVANQQYQIVFYAHDTSSTFSDYKEGKITVDYSNITVNSTADDAFINKKTYNGAANQVFTADGVTKTVYLTRPFAQVNIGTNDLDNAAVQAIINGITTKLDITTGLYTDYTVLGDVVATEATETVTATTGAPKVNEDFPVAGYSNLMSLYLLVPQTKDLVDATYTINVNGTTANTLDLASMPVQGNYRTNVYGALLTTQNRFNVEIDPIFAGQYNSDDAVVEIEDGKVVCISPKLPTGVTEADLQGQGGVALDANGQPVYFAPTGAAISQAMQQYPEIYLAPNAVITTTSHAMVVPQSGVTVHGNGATITGSENDFSINTTYQDGSTVNVNISNLNNFKVWGTTKGDCTVNINLTSCALNGTGLTDGSSLVMARGQDADPCVTNISIDGCYVSGVQVAIHSTHPGTVELKNCTFKNVGIPLNIAKKLAGAKMTITVDGCSFDACGIAPDDTANSAYSYAAPIRVVDNGGPADAITLAVNNCTFSGTLSQWDILLMDYRSGKTWFPVKYTISGCTPADPTVRAN